LLGSATLAARTVTDAGFGTAAGAVYRPDVEIVPFKAPPSTDQVTAVFVVPVTVAANCCVSPSPTDAVPGATVTTTPAAATTVTGP
jgi:hypothetical protein